jgi:hypothetical protein
LFQCKNRGNQNGGNNGGKKNCLKLKKRDSRLNNNNYNPGSNNSDNRYRENYESQDMVFTVTLYTERFEDDVIVVQVYTIALWIEACLMLKTSMRTFELVMEISEQQQRLVVASVESFKSMDHLLISFFTILSLSQIL